MLVLVPGPYRKCVYESDVDVCDNQVRVYDETTLDATIFPPSAELTTHAPPKEVVDIQYASGATASFTMVAYTTLICERQTRMHFTFGEIVGDMNQFTVTDFRTGQSTLRRPPAEGGGHGGDDFSLMRTFVDAVRTRRQDLLGTDVTDVLKSHLTVFAAEHSRKTGTVVDYLEFENVARRACEGSVQNSATTAIT